MRLTLAFVLTTACLSTEELSFPLREEAQSFALIVFEGDRRALIGYERDTQVPLSIAKDAELYVLAFDRPAADLALPLGLIELAAEGRPLPRASAWARGTYEGFGDWTEESVPSKVSEIRLPKLALPDCWAMGGCAAIEPIGCNLPCTHAAPAPPIPPDRRPLAPLPPMMPALPAWIPAALEECPPGEAQLYGEESCAPIGPACPAAGDWRSDIPGGAIYVDADRAVDGDGSSASPRNRIPGALPPGTVLALGRGTYDLAAHPMLSSVAIHGACVAGTSLINVTLADDSELHALRLPEGADLVGTGGLIRAVESLGTLSIRGSAIANELAVRSATVGVDAIGDLTLDRFYAKDVTASAAVVNGSLVADDVVIDGVTGSPAGVGALMVIGPGTIRRVYLEDVERFGLLAATAPNGGVHQIEDVAVRRLRGLPYDRENPADASRGALWIDGKSIVERVQVEDSGERGILFSGAGAGMLSDVTIDGTTASEATGGDGILVITSTNTRIDRVQIRDTQGPAIIMLRSDVVLYDLSIAQRGSGVFVQERSRLHLERAELADFAAGALGVGDSELTLVDTAIRDLSAGAIGILVRAESSASVLNVERMLMEGFDGTGVVLHSIGAPVTASMDDLTVRRIRVFLQAEGEAVAVDARHAQVEEGGIAAALLGGSIHVSDWFLDRMRTGFLLNPSDFGRQPISTDLRVERLLVTEHATSVLHADRPPAGVHLEDVEIRSGRGAVVCSGELQDLPQMTLNLVRLAIRQTTPELDAVGIETNECMVSGSDLALSGSNGIGAAVSGSGFAVERFIFEGNQTGLRSDVSIQLLDGVFRDNRVALDLGGARPEAAQLLGVSFVDNDVDLD